MARYTPISQSTHQSSGWKLIADYSFAANDALAPVSMAEVSELVPRYTLAFYRAKESDPLQLVALLGLFPGKNLYVSPQGKWIGGYVPAVYRGYPFRMIPLQESDKAAMCIDEASESFSSTLDDESQHLFDASGALSELASKVKNFLVAQQAERGKTESLIALLDEYGVLKPWGINLEGRPESVAPHTGLYHVSEPLLKDLSAEKLKVLNLKGALAVAYTQMLSEHRMKDLVRLFNIRSLEAKNSSKQQPSHSDIDLDTLFGENDDLLRF